jgi:hypothetical protein
MIAMRTPAKFRSGEQQVIVLVIGIVGGVGICLLGLLPVPGEPEAGLADPRRILPITLGVGVGIFVTTRVATMAIVVHETLIEVRNPVRSSVIEWHEIESFDLEPWGPWPEVCIVRCLDGRQVRAFALTPPNPLLRSGSKVRAQVEELNSMLPQGPGRRKVRHGG